MGTGSKVLLPVGTGTAIPMKGPGGCGDPLVPANRSTLNKWGCFLKVADVCLGVKKEEFIRGAGLMMDEGRGD